jgi:hypothetical protein
MRTVGAMCPTAALHLDERGYFISDGKREILRVTRYHDPMAERALGLLVVTLLHPRSTWWSSWRKGGA